MLIRLPLAFVVGLVVYMIAMAMTVYDGLLSMIFQPIVGSILTIPAVVAVLILGSPLLLESVWPRWQRLAWISPLLFGLGAAAFVASWALRVEVWDELEKRMTETFQPHLGVGGWLAMIFAVAWCPLIGFYRDRRWV